MAGYDRHHCCVPLVSKVQSSITHAQADQAGQVYDNAGFCLEPGCSGWVLLVSHGFAFWIMILAFPEAQTTCRVKMPSSDATIAKEVGAMGRFPFFSLAQRRRFHTTSVIISTSALKPDVCTRLLGDFAKVMLEFQDAKGIVPAPAQVTATFLRTTAWWKQGSSFQLVDPGSGLKKTVLVCFGFGCFKMAQNL